MKTYIEQASKHIRLQEGTQVESLIDLLPILEEFLSQRPSVDVQIDQSKCTPETSLRRAILCLNIMH